MKRTKFQIFSFLILILFVSCKKLDEQPKSFVTPDNFYTTSAQIEATFASSMNALWDAWSAYGYGMATFANDDQLDGGNLNITEDWGSDLWAAHYNAIMNLNAAIGAMNKGSLKGVVSTEDQNVLMAQSKFLRGFNYFMLVRMFGGVPLMTEETENPFQAKVKRADVSEVYKLITDDLTYASQNLPPSWPPAMRGRPTSDVAKALLAKAYLTMATYPLNQPENYKKAADLTSQIIADSRYALVHDIDRKSVV